MERKMEVVRNSLGWTNFHSDAKAGRVFTDLEILKLATNQGYTVAHVQAFHGNPVPRECYQWATEPGYLGDNERITVRHLIKMFR
jgi:hypothetical protein